MYKGKTIAVVCPAYNEELLIADTIKSVPDFVDQLYVVNDGSTDRTAEIVRSLSNDRMFCIDHQVNRGVGAAIASGYKKAIEDDVDITVVMAGDNQMDPEHVAKLLDPIIAGEADYAKGDRLSTKRNDEGMSRWRRFGNWLLTWLTRIATGDWKVHDPQNGFTAISNQTMKRLGVNAIYPGYGYCNDILVKLNVYGCKIVNVPMPARYGREISKIRYSRYIPKVSWLLLRRFIWRITRRRGNHSIRSYHEVMSSE